MLSTVLLLTTRIEATITPLGISPQLCMFVRAARSSVTQDHLKPHESEAPSRTSSALAMSTPRFFQTPFRYMRWASHEKPAIFYSIVLGSLGPLSMPIVPPIRRYFGDGPREPIPQTYPGEICPCCFLCGHSAFPSSGVAEDCDDSLESTLCAMSIQSLIVRPVPTGPRKKLEGYDDE